MRLPILVLLGLLSVQMARTASLPPFVFVMIDSKTEAQYGSLPFNRLLVAKAIENLAAAKAKGIILKFFYDLPSTEERDRALELSICGAPVALQGCLNDVEGSANALMAKFEIDANPLPAIPPLFWGDKALIPLPRFSRCAQA